MKCNWGFRAPPCNEAVVAKNQHGDLLCQKHLDHSLKLKATRDAEQAAIDALPAVET